MGARRIPAMTLDVPVGPKRMRSGAPAEIGLWFLIAVYAATTLIPRFVPAFGTLLDIALSVAAALSACRSSTTWDGTSRSFSTTNSSPLYLAGRSGPMRTGQPRPYWYQAAVFFFVIAVGYPAGYLGGRDVPVTDATGATWRTGNIYETAAIVSIYTLLFVSMLSFLKIGRRGNRAQPTERD